MRILTPVKFKKMADLQIIGNKILSASDLEEMNMAEVRTRKQKLRVRFYPTDTDETFDGTVIDEKPNFYVVIPDQNLALTQNWNKKRCDIIPSHSA
jgi:hypothetical protein